MPLFVERESQNTKSRFVTPTWSDKDEKQRVLSSSDPLPIIDINHQRLHEGRAHFVYHLHPGSATLAAGSSINIAMAFPEGVNAHAVFFFECGGSAEFYAYENASVSGGTAKTIIRRNRNNPGASQGVAVLNPTVSNVGTEIFAEFIASGQGGTASGGSGFSFEFVLDDLTSYLFRLTNTSAQAHPAELRIDWYE